eukprot:comp21546_c0_seq1/m.47187 comp21546_c0_seq1/g.47187  ORF comp21546_c0_seq1/g.47187 comp21546_c0_seq1/m.47187 type:complete len:459 (-) comp21546_c0_seq1:18-1394(-)
MCTRVDERSDVREPSRGAVEGHRIQSLCRRTETGPCERLCVALARDLDKLVQGHLDIRAVLGLCVLEVGEQHTHHCLMCNDHNIDIDALKLNDQRLQPVNQIKIALAPRGIAEAQLVFAARAVHIRHLFAHFLVRHAFADARIDLVEHMELQHLVQRTLALVVDRVLDDVGRRHRAIQRRAPDHHGAARVVVVVAQPCAEAMRILDTGLTQIRVAAKPVVEIEHTLAVARHVHLARLEVQVKQEKHKLRRQIAVDVLRLELARHVVDLDEREMLLDERLVHLGIGIETQPEVVHGALAVNALVVRILQLALQIRLNHRFVRANALDENHIHLEPKLAAQLLLHKVVHEITPCARRVRCIKDGHVAAAVLQKVSEIVQCLLCKLLAQSDGLLVLAEEKVVVVVRPKCGSALVADVVHAALFAKPLQIAPQLLRNVRLAARGKPHHHKNGLHIALEKKRR